MIRHLKHHGNFASLAIISIGVVAIGAVPAAFAKQAKGSHHVVLNFDSNSAPKNTSGDYDDKGNKDANAPVSAVQCDDSNMQLANYCIPHDARSTGIITITINYRDKNGMMQSKTVPDADFVLFHSSTFDLDVSGATGGDPCYLNNQGVQICFP